VPDQPFIRMASGDWSYGWVDTESDRVAAGLHALGVRQGESVSLLLPNRITFAVLWFALAKLSAVAAPVNTAQRIADFAAGRLCAGGHDPQSLDQAVQISLRGVDGR
jgi:crotonobetaine/carnitine-CoA ligase